MLTEAGAVLSFGDGGCLGHGDEEHQLTPKVIEALSGERAVAVAAGNGHSLVLTEAGAVFSFGRCGGGQLGHGDTMNQHLPRLIEALRGDHVVEVAAGYSHSVCRTRDGRAFGWGIGGETLGLQVENHQHVPLEYPALHL